MSPSDRELLQTLRRQQAELGESLARIGRQLETLEAGAENRVAHEPHPVPQLPPLPESRQTEVPPPPPRALPPLPTAILPPVPTVPPPPRPSLEFQFGRWLTRIGAVFGVITLALILSLTHHYLFALLGRTGILGLSGACCMGVIILALRLERRDLFVYARSLLALGLAGLYVTLYGAYGFDSVRVIHSPLLAGLLLLLWSVYVFYLAEIKKSHALALSAIALAYFSTAINPIGRFSMGADLLLAGTAVVFLLRHGWSSLSFLSLLGTYFALARRLVLDENGHVVLDTSRTLPFAPYAVYLIGAWMIFTGAVQLSTSPFFRGGKRLTFLSLNNGALVGLLTLTTYLAGYGYQAMGWTLLWCGIAFLASAILNGGRRPDSGFGDVTNAYFAQGLAAVTLGLMGIYTGVTRGVLLAFETFVLGVTSTFSRSAVVRVTAAASALLATVFLLWEIAYAAHHPWLLGWGGALVMFANAWWARCASLRPRRDIMLGASYYCALALALLATAMNAELSDSALPVAFAFLSVGLTFAVYLVPLYEMAPLAQTLLLAAQALVLFPAETGEAMPRSSTAWVAILTVVMLAWWSRQRLMRQGPWLVALNFIYALALVGLSYHAVRPYVDHSGWMIAASVLSALFLFFGALLRIWPVAAIGQAFLAVAVYHFFLPNGVLTPFTWPWWAAMFPIAVAFANGRAIHTWLIEYPDVPAALREPLRALGYAHKLLTLALVARLIFGRLTPGHQIEVFLFLGTFLLLWNTVRTRPFGVRCSFFFSALGLLVFAQQLQVNPRGLITFGQGLALFALLCQPTLLRHAVRRLVSKGEGWLLILLSAGAGWVFVHVWLADRLHSHNLTMGWALYAVFLFTFGQVVRDRRQRWCGLGILAAAMVRVVYSDIWAFSNGYKVLTFVVLTLITLGLGFVYARYAERLRSWL